MLNVYKENNSVRKKLFPLFIQYEITNGKNFFSTLLLVQTRPCQHKVQAFGHIIITLLEEFLDFLHLRLKVSHVVQD